MLQENLHCQSYVVLYISLFFGFGFSFSNADCMHRVWDLKCKTWNPGSATSLCSQPLEDSGILICKNVHFGFAMVNIYHDKSSHGAPCLWIPKGSLLLIS